MKFRDNKMRIRRENLVEVYVWELPVRFFHWTNALCIVILILTGLIIANPPAIMTENDAYHSYWFGTVRFVHFVTAFVFFFNFVFRIYWGFVGNRFARWNNFVELNKSQWMEILDVIKGEILLMNVKPFNNIGHNRLAALTYTGLFGMFLLQCITGWGIYAEMSESFFPQLFSWVVPFMGGLAVARMVHHVLMWLFIIFAMIHIYLVWYSDYIERRGEASSMVGGWKFVEESKARMEDIKEKAEIITESAKKHKKDPHLIESNESS